MGFNPNRTAVLKFANPAWADALVKIRLSVPTGRYLEIRDIVFGEDRPPEWAYKYFGDELLLEWNLEDDDGNPYPTSYEGVCQIDMNFINDCISAWVDAVGSVSDPLPQVSLNGIPELGLDLASLSEPK